MKKLTAGIFTVLMGLVSVNAADAAVASKGYVTQEINKVNANVNAVDTKVGDLKYSSVNYIAQDEGLTVSAGKLDAAIKDLADDLSSLSGGQGSVADQISNALKEVTATVDGDVNGVVTGVTQTDGKVTATRALITNDNIAGNAAIAVSKIDGLGSLATKSEVAETDLATALATKINGKQDALGYTAEDAANKVSDYDEVADDANKAVLYPSITAMEGYVSDTITELNSENNERFADIENSLAEGGDTANAIKANADAIEDLKDADTTINGKLDVLNGADTVEGSVAKAEADAIAAAKAYADGLAGNYDAAGSAATAETNAKEYAVGKANTAQTNAVNYTDSVVSGLNLSDIARVPADCSKPENYCALTTNGTQFVWEVIERGVEEDGTTPEKVPAGDAVVLNAITTPAKPATIE